MSGADRFFSIAINVLVLIVLTGLVARRRARLCIAFSVYLAAVAVTGTLILVRPDRFFVWSFYVPKEFGLNLLKLLIVLELSARIFQAFAAARRTAVVILLVVLGATAVSIALAPSDPALQDRNLNVRAATLMASLQPRIANGTAWLFGSVFILILYYRIPLHPFHRAIAFGFMPYLLLTTVLFDQLRRHDFGIAPYLSSVDTLSYLLLLAYWAWAAWRRDPPPPVAPEVVSRLQPWRKGASPDL
jgi:hypothetical protein